MDLKELRYEIDGIDRELTALLERRMDIAARIAAYKRENGLPVLDASREGEKLAAVAAMCRPETAEPISDVFAAVMAASRKYQSALLGRRGGAFGLLGRKLGHSWSPQIHALLCGYKYGLYEVEPEALGDFLQTTALSGMNVTIPYKKDVVPYCAALSDAAKRIGSVNTLVRTVAGWYGDNTDYAGFIAMVERCGVPVRGRKTLVFGSGGASLAVLAALRDLGAEPIVNISRSGPDNYENLSRHADAEILVNTTPLGMYPDVDSAPVSLDAFPQCAAVLDVVYNPTRTRLLMDAEARGIPCAGGLTMLVAQARRSAEQFQNAPIDGEKVEEIVRILERRMQNIILIGMPGCGKSSIGRALAERTGRPLIDADERIAERAGMTIPQIFASEGEAGFRRREAEVLAELGMGSGAVIATGGGCVTRAENYPLLHRNGVIFWIKRDIALLPSAGRPLSQRDGPEALYRERKEKYAAFADFTIENDETVGQAAEKIMEVFQ